MRHVASRVDGAPAAGVTNGVADAREERKRQRTEDLIMV